MSQADAGTVIDDGRARLSDLWKKEDYWAIWLGFFVLLVGIFLFVVQVPDKFRTTVNEANGVMRAESAKAPFRTIAYYNAQDAKKKLRASDSNIGKAINTYLAIPQRWTSNPLTSFYVSKESAEAVNAKGKPAANEAKAGAIAALEAAAKAEMAATDADYKDSSLNAIAEVKIADWRKAQSSASSASAKASTRPVNILPTLLVIMIFFMVFFGVGMVAMGYDAPKYAMGFMGVFIVTVLAFMMGSQSTMKVYGIGSEAWAIIFGMIVANTVGTPSFMRPALQTEFYIKTGLVLLGAEVLFDKIVAIGIPGIFVAWVVTPIVLVVTFIFGQKVLKIPSKTLNITISADMSVCGTSAAIATAAACRAKKEELTLAIGLSLVFTAIMMIAMPMFIKAMNIPEVLGGAWMGGTIDATGAVAAAGAFLGEKALYVAATIKMIQNVLIGVTAFCVAVYWTTKVEPEEQGLTARGQRMGIGEIWNRFPKFVLGFLAASIIASLISGSLGSDLSHAVVSQGLAKGIASPMRSWCFALAFTAIGLSTNFRELVHYFKGGKPVILYVCGQSLNLLLTFVMAYIMFYLVFPEITARI